MFNTEVRSAGLQEPTAVSQFGVGKRKAAKAAVVRGMQKHTELAKFLRYTKLLHLLS
jgi:hypothetical protein